MNVYKFNKLEEASADGIFLPNQHSQYFLSKTTQQKEEDLNIIYQLCFHGGSSKLVMLGFYGNYAYVWDKQENMQIMSVDTKGGNRPIKLRVQG